MIDECLELILKRERPRSLTYVFMNKEFSYLRLVNDRYFANLFMQDSINDFCLDAYNHWKKNNVVGAKHEALLTTLKMMYSEAVKYGKE
jgi:hypothetical protein